MRVFGNRVTQIVLRIARRRFIYFSHGIRPAYMCVSVCVCACRCVYVRMCTLWHEPNQTHAYKKTGSSCFLRYNIITCTVHTPYIFINARQVPRFSGGFFFCYEKKKQFSFYTPDKIYAYVEVRFTRRGRLSEEKESLRRVLTFD